MQRVDASFSPACYSGSPLSYSFAEANQQKYLLLVEVVPDQTASVREIPLACGKQLLRKKAQGMEDALEWLSKNQNALVELTLVTDTYLTAQERRKLQTAHDGIVAIIPELSRVENLNQNMEGLFRDYFKYTKGQEPNAEMIKLFQEILAEEEEEK
jgi:exonuclease SbcD